MQTHEQLIAERDELWKIVEQANADLLDAAQALAGTPHFRTVATASGQLLLRVKKLKDARI